MDQFPTEHLQTMFAALPESDRTGVIGKAIQSLLFMGGHALQWVTTSRNLTALDQVRIAISDMGSVHTAFLQEHTQRLVDAGRLIDPDFCWNWEQYMKEIADTTEHNMQMTLTDFQATAQKEFTRLCQDQANKALRLQAVFGLLNVFVGAIKLKNAFEILGESAASIAENGAKLNAIREQLNAIEAKLPTLLELIEKSLFNRANALAQDCREQVQDCASQLANLKTSVEGRIVTVKNLLDERFMDFMQQSISGICNVMQLAQVAAHASTPLVTLCSVLVTANGVLAAGNVRAYYLSKKQIEELQAAFREIGVVEQRCSGLQRQFKAAAQEIAARLDQPETNNQN